MQYVERLDVDTGGKASYIVRDMMKKDIAEILALQDKVLHGSGFDSRWFYPFSKEELEEFVEEAAGLSVGVFVKGKLRAFRMGCFSGMEYDEITRALGSPYRETLCFLMNGVFVDQAFRGNHLQQMLTEQCIARCRKRGIETFLAVVHPDNLPSIKSLKNIGFTERSRQKIFDGKYDRIILVYDAAASDSTEYKRRDSNEGEKEKNG